MTTDRDTLPEHGFEPSDSDESSDGSEDTESTDDRSDWESDDDEWLRNVPEIDWFTSYTGLDHCAFCGADLYATANKLGYFTHVLADGSSGPCGFAFHESCVSRYLGGTLLGGPRTVRCPCGKGAVEDGVYSSMLATSSGHDPEESSRETDAPSEDADAADG